MSDTLKKAKTMASRASLVDRIEPFIRAKTTVAKILSKNRRRISALGGIHYNILVPIDATKESWRALAAVLYFFDLEKDIVNTISIKDSTKGKDITTEIKRVVEKTFPSIAPWQLRTDVLEPGNEITRDRILDLVSKHNYDLLALGIQGRKNNPMNPQRIFGNGKDLSVRSAKCTTLIAPSCAELPVEDESGVFVVVIDGSINSQHAYETARAWMKEGDYLYAIKVDDPRGDDPKTPVTMRSSFVGRQYSTKLSDMENASYLQLSGKKIVPEIIQFCREVNAHFLFCGADEMRTWANDGDVIGSVSDSLVKESECFLIVSRINIVHE